MNITMQTTDTATGSAQLPIRAALDPSVAPLSPGLTDHLKVEYRPVSCLSPPPRQTRKHSKAQVQAIARSLERFGFVNPILVGDDGQVIAGFGRLLAAKQLGIAEVPTLRLTHLTPAECRAYALADNKLAELSGWDRDLLALELQDLGQLDIDLTLTGFALPEIAVLTSELGRVSDEPIEPDTSGAPAVTRLGDLWLAGPHRILCGDATVAADYATLLGDGRAKVVFIDPPYNVPIQGHVSGLGAVQHGEFVMASGEMTPEQFTAFLATTFGRLAEYSELGSIHFVCMDWRHLRELLDAGNRSYTALKNLCVWVKDNGGMGSLYRSQHELVAVFKSGDSPHVNNVELGKHGRYRTNVWNYPGGSSLRRGRADELAMHPTVKPVALIVDALLDCSQRGDTVLDSFGGSGSTLMAADRTGRRARLMELAPHYVDVIVQRYQRTTGQTVTNAVTGQSFAEVQAARLQMVGTASTGGVSHEQ